MSKLLRKFRKDKHDGEKNEDIIPAPAPVPARPIPKRAPERHPVATTVSTSKKSPAQNTSDKYRLVIGIDFGTTQSGVAFALLEPGQEIKYDEIITISSWAGRNEDYEAPKVASVLAYDTQNNNQISWGNTVPESQQKLEWLKILLEPKADEDVKLRPEVLETQAFLERHNLSPVMAVGAYLKELWTHAKRLIIDETTKSVFESAEKTIVLSVPAAWSPKAHHNTFTAAVLAGLNNQNYTLKLVTEPQAAAVAVLAQKKSTFYKSKMSFVVCDAGGGTVDLISYQVTAIEPLQLTPRVGATGALCGSVFLNSYFKDLLRNDLSPQNFDSMPTRVIDEMMYTFEKRIKTQFTARSNEKFFIDFLLTQDLPNVTLHDGKLYFDLDALQGIFDPICSKIDDLITGQLEALKKKSLETKYVVLVGGFGGNQYLLDYLRENNPNIEFLRLNSKDSLAAIAKGAVLSELIGTTKIFDVYISRHNIGVRVYHDYNDKTDQDRRTIYCPYRKAWYVTDGIKWCVRKDDEIRSQEKQVFNFEHFEPLPNDTVTLPRTINIGASLVVSDSSNATNREESDVRPFVDMEFYVNSSLILSKFPIKEKVPGFKYLQFPYQVEMKKGDADLEFRCNIGGTIVGHAAHIQYCD